MENKIEQHKKDLNNLIKSGDNLFISLQKLALPVEFEKTYKEILGEDKYKNFIKDLPIFDSKYENWYSESLYIVKQFLPDRLEDFKRQYEKPKVKRKDITSENYVIEDALQGLEISRTDGFNHKKIIAGINSSIPKFQQQLNILKSVEQRFESSLFDIKQLVQADLFDSEIEVCKELLKKGFNRAAGAVAGVVLEGHLSQVCKNHKLTLLKKNPTISDYNNTLKENEIYETPTWRKIQHLGDLRNLCDHKKLKDPKLEDIEDLINGVKKVIKNIF